VIVRLRLMNSLQVGASITVAKSPFVIGRHADCDLKINSPRVSVFHCSLITAEGVSLVKDMDSTNGTRVNGEPVTEPREIRHADVIWVGPALIEVTMEDGEVEAASASNYSATNPYLKLSDLK
jgi:pSer/pThr/pTyr-binding forkhead associated (FHA) protein